MNELAPLILVRSIAKTNEIHGLKTIIRKRFISLHTKQCLVKGVSLQSGENLEYPCISIEGVTFKNIYKTELKKKMLANN